MLNQKCISLTLLALFYPHSVLALVIELGLNFLVLNFGFFGWSSEANRLFIHPSSNPLPYAIPNVLFMVEYGNWLRRVVDLTVGVDFSERTFCAQFEKSVQPFLSSFV